MNLYAVFGKPVINSLSPVIWSKLLKDKKNSFYIRINPYDINNLIYIVNKLNIKAFNLTSPYKTAILKHIDKLCKFSSEIEAVNFVEISDSKLYGYNTDVYGLKKSLEKFTTKKVLVLGAGGAARAVLYNLKKKEVFLYNRSYENTLFLQNIAKFNYVEDYDKFLKNNKVDLLINTIPNFNVFSFIKKHQDIKILDANYNINNFKNYTNGKIWLIEQALASYKILFNKRYSKKIYLNINKEPKALSINGFMATGKSSIIKYLNYTSIDLDKQISKKYNIKDYFKKNGESKFRKLESSYLKKVDLTKYKILSLGGGTILYNSKYLKNNTYRILIYSSFKDIKNRLSKDKLRPLNNANLEKLYNLRLNKYIKNSDLILINKRFLNFKKAIILELNAYYKKNS